MEWAVQHYFVQLNGMIVSTFRQMVLSMEWSSEFFPKEYNFLPQNLIVLWTNVFFFNFLFQVMSSHVADIRETNYAFKSS